MAESRLFKQVIRKRQDNAWRAPGLWHCVAKVARSWQKRFATDEGRLAQVRQSGYGGALCNDYASLSMGTEGHRDFMRADVYAATFCHKHPPVGGNGCVVGKPDRHVGGAVSDRVGIVLPLVDDANQHPEIACCKHACSEATRRSINSGNTNRSQTPCRLKLASGKLLWPSWRGLHLQTTLRPCYPARPTHCCHRPALPGSLPLR